MIAQEARRTVLIDLAGGNGQDEGNNFRLRCLDQVSVDEQEGKGGKVGGPFIAVRKGVIACKTVQISCG